MLSAQDPLKEDPFVCVAHLNSLTGVVPDVEALQGDRLEIRASLWLRQSRICLKCRRPGLSPWIRKIPWRRAWQFTPIFLLEESPGQRSLEGYSPEGHKGSDTTEMT